jgi:HPt (histidine-containing phosphotransfer) domain-containing protein
MLAPVDLLSTENSVMNEEKLGVNPQQVDDAPSKMTNDPDAASLPQTLEDLLKPFAGNESFYRRLIGVFEKNLAQQLVDIDRMISERNIKELIVLVHTLKGTSGTVRLSPLYRALYDWELKLTQFDVSDVDPANHHYADLGQHISTIAHSELAHIHTLLATSMDNEPQIKTGLKTAPLNETFSLAQLTSEFDELNEHLRQGNLDAIAQCQALQIKLAADKRFTQDLITLCDCVEELDFDSALAHLSKLAAKLT